jgi:Protein of unknown function (DUF2971)
MKTKTAAEQHIGRLYHYDPYSCPARLAHVLQESVVYCSNPNDFNDPWDCKPHYSKSALNDPVGYRRTVEWFVRAARKIDQSISDAEHTRREGILLNDRPRLEWMVDKLSTSMVEAVIAQYRVYCLSTRPDLPLMWSHYARSHRGVCLEFGVKNELFCGAFPVDYLDAFPEMDLTDNTEDAALQALLSKSREWAYENEYRLITAAPGYSFPNVPPTRDNFVALPTGSLKSVIFGCLMPQSDRENIAALVGKFAPQVMLKLASRIPDRYALRICDV